MNVGQALLLAAAAFGVLAVASSRWPRVSGPLVRVHVALVVGSMLLLLFAFVAGAVEYAYVFGHTSTQYPLHYRIAGAWGGEEGTLLLWNAGVAVALFVVSRRAGEPLHGRASVALLGGSTALAVVGVVVDVFRATPAADLVASPSGRGLADVLLTPLMVVHPPIQFVAYALLAVPAAFAVAHLWGGGRGDRAWARAAYPWARVAWLFATTGLGLGALWAYYVLSFGGYWAWDPVETSNLLPWLALTAFLHAAKHHEKFGDHAVSAPALALAGTLMALFATFATRSGLWASVHAFTDPTDRFEPDAAARFLAILDVHAPTRAVVSLFGLATLGAASLLAAHHAREAGGASRRYLEGHAVFALALAGAFAADPSASWGMALAAASAFVPVGLGLAALAGWILGAPLLLAYLARDSARVAMLDPRRVMAWGVALFVVALVVAFVLNMQVVDRPDRGRFDVRAPFVVLPLVSVLTLMMALPPLGRRGAVVLAAGSAGAGLALFAFATQDRVLALAFPFALGALVATLLRLAHVEGRPRVASLAVTGMGVALLTLAANPPTHAAGQEVPSGPWVAAFGMLGGAALLVLGLRLARGRIEPARLREAGIALVHLAVALGVLGYAASTYSQDRETFTAVPVGSLVEVGDYVLLVGEPVTAEEAGELVSARIPVALSREGGEVGESSLDFSWRGPPASQYQPRLEVRRHVAEDVYLAPLAFHTSEGWVGGGSAGARVAASEVDAVTFTASVLPLVGLVWAGLWLGVVAMLLILGSMLLARRQG